MKICDLCGSEDVVWSDKQHGVDLCKDCAIEQVAIEQVKICPKCEGGDLLIRFDGPTRTKGTHYEAECQRCRHVWSGKIE